MRTLRRWTLFLSGAVLVDLLAASEVPLDRHKRQARPFDDELPTSVQPERSPFNRWSDTRARSAEQRREPRVHDPRQDPRQDPRYDPRQDPRQDPRYDPRQDSRNDPGQDPRYDLRQDPRYDPRQDPRNDPRNDPRYESRSEPRYDPRYDPRAQERTAPPRRPPAASRYDPRLENFLMGRAFEELGLNVSAGRQYYQELFAKRRRIYTEFDDLGEDKGNWSEWATDAPCSRSCGGGVTFRQRVCLEGVCGGPSRVYSTCNKHDCPKDETQEDFLLKQCQRMNSIPVDGRYYNWVVRRRHDRNPCELSCSPRERDLELKFRQNVIDGTRCYHAGFDQCVEGQCVATGCDGLLGSKKRIDKCLVCGGGNNNCNTTVLTESRDQLPSGYVPLVVIPKGATSIMVRESKVTRNYISLKDLNGVWYINKNYEIDESKAFIAGNAKFHYTRNPQYLGGREFLRADGPTNETLVVMLLVQQMNEGFEFEFSLKEIPGQPRPRSGEFQWVKGEWDPCTDPCGERNTTRSVRCASIITNLDAADRSECDAAEEPASEKNCPVDSCQSEWYVGNWERCNNTCGDGLQTRAVFCSTAAGEGVRVLPDPLCKGKGERPSSEQECTSNESCDKWEVGEWGESERKCGVTKQFREVTCVRQMENSTEGVEVDAPDCLEDLKPAAEQEVFLEPCHDVEWATGEWSVCSECHASVQSRKVECVNDEGQLYEESFCAAKTKPETEQPCEDLPPCEYRWFASEWSPCSAPCGAGVQTRVVFCGQLEVNSTNASIVEETNCQGDPPLGKQTCEGEPCEHIWLSAPWNKQCPENTCGGIPRKRQSFCYSKGQLASDCREDQKPKDTDVCSPQACAGDVIDVLGGCVSTEHGCCPDGVKAAGPGFEGCPPLDPENFTTPCEESQWGCCRDLVTPAFGPFDAGCSLFALCNGTEFGCCQDGETAAQGSNFSGCAIPCDTTEFGCCPDETTAALDEQMSGCTNATTPEKSDEEILAVGSASFDIEDAGSGGSGHGEIEGSGGELVESKCEESELGCCPDNLTPAKDAKKRKGCVHCRAHKYGCCPDGVTAALGRKFKGCVDACGNSTFGCCSDGFFPAKGPAHEGCQPGECKDSKFGCCGQVKIPALGPEGEGCGNCTESAYGCCANNEDFALGPNNEGCCADSQFGCCPDGKILAQGPDLAGCPCSTLKFGCCPDKITPALGPKLYGCSCETSEFGCCPDLLTPALGPAQANCTCDRSAFGCCPDGVSVALGPDSQKSCDCRTSTFGCCPDGRTPATGPSQRGCHCATMKYGCCPDNQTPAAGPNFAGCPCHTTHYGCCLDGFTKKLSPRGEGCEDCTKLKFGCCPDGDHAARGPDFQGCPCDTTEFGCCPDRVTPAKGADNEGCPQVPCHLTQFGCCPDETAAAGRDYKGCNLTDEERRRYEEHRRGVESRRRYPEEHAERAPYHEPRRMKEACFQNQDRGPCSKWTLVYFYNSQNNTCNMFYYGGCGGNDNRFPDSESCSRLCQSSGPVGPDLEHLQPVDANEVISPNRRAQRYPCDLAKDPGTCTGHFERFWYDQSTNQCERFMYGGCQGNDNRFINQKACTERCKILSDREKCLLPAVVSKNCSDPQTLFRYNYKLTVCEPYKGCTEDTNVFRDYNSCVKTCQHLVSSRDIMQEVCALPMDSGPCSDFTELWAFENGRCTPFYYGGCEGNANRFATQEECQSICDRSSQSPQPGNIGSGAITSRTSSSVHICEQPREVGPCQNFEPRYHFDSASRSCYSFNYGGCGGNMNNFLNLEDCQRRCMYRFGAIAPQPPRSSSFNVGDCQAPKDRGTCSGNSIMFYYNPADGVCREFTYSGCGGNLNRFTTRNECDRSCKNAQNRCKLPTIKGRCGGAYRMWTYDAQKDICKQFDYGGCQGNANRFDSKTECEKSCVSGTLEVSGISNDFPDKCRLKADSGGCAHNLHKFYFDLRLGKCLPFLWGGCEGNDNRFETFNDCQKACTIPAMRANLISPNRENSLDAYEVPLSKNEICSLPSKPGHRNCSDAQNLIRFYYDARSDRCLPFAYEGCDGNKNNFISIEKCTSFCGDVRASREDPGFARRVPAAADHCPPDKCGTLSCRGMGERREIMADNCARCVCNHPCDGTRCSSEDKCAVIVSQGNYLGVCRPSKKPGECPQLSCVEADRGKNFCKDDSSCGGAQKCCNSGCNQVCVEPQPEDEDIRELIAFEDGAASLECLLHYDNSVHWIKDGEEVEGERFDRRDNYLIIKKTSKDDAGVYVCFDDELPDHKVRFALRIAAPPRIIKDDPVVESPIAGTANLSCTVIGGYPKPSIVWSKNQTRLPMRSNKYKQLPHNTLQVFDVRNDDQDLYLCTASNEHGRANFMVALVIPVLSNEEHQSKGQALAQKARADAKKPSI